MYGYGVQLLSLPHPLADISLSNSKGHISGGLNCKEDLGPVIFWVIFNYRSHSPVTG